MFLTILLSKLKINIYSPDFAKKSLQVGIILLDGWILVFLIYISHSSTIYFTNVLSLQSFEFVLTTFITLNYLFNFLTKWRRLLKKILKVRDTFLFLCYKVIIWRFSQIFVLIQLLWVLLRRVYQMKIISWLESIIKMIIKQFVFIILD